MPRAAMINIAVLRFLLFLLWCLAIAVVIFGSLSPQLAPPSGVVIDKLIHAASYAVLMVLAALCLPWPAMRGAAAIFLLCLGGCIEVLQAILGGREASAWDMLGNAIGILVGLVIFKIGSVYVAPLRALTTARSAQPINEVDVDGASRR